MGTKTFDQLPVITSTNDADKLPIWDTSASQAAGITVANLLGGIILANGSNAMTGNLDMGGNAISNVGNVDGVDVSALSSAYTSHAADATLHRVINDAGTSSTELWSASKISTAISAIDLSDYIARDGADTLTGDWDIGDGRYIAADKIRARDAAGLLLQDDGGTGITIADGGTVTMDLAGTGGTTRFSTPSGRTGIIWGSSNRQHISSDDDALYLSAATGTETPATSSGIAILNEGNIGIGTASPDNKVHIFKASAGTVAADSTTALALENSSDCTLEFLTPNANAAWIVFSKPGSVFNGSMRYVHETSGGKFIFSGAAFGALYEMNLTHLKPSVDDYLDLGGASYRWDDVYATNGVIQTSDIRQKELVEESDLGLDFILALEPKKWVWRNREVPASEVDGVERPALTKTYRRPHYGLSAQQVKEAMDTLGIDDFAGYVHNADADAYALRYNEFMGPIIKAIKELNERISALEGLN